MFNFRPFGWFLKSIGAIPIDRDGIGLGGIKESLKLLKHGEMVLIFPEGTRTPDGEIAAFRPGFTTLAARSNAAILPVAIDGAYQAWPRTQKYPGLGRIRVHFGKPIPHAEIAGRDERELARRSRAPRPRMPGHAPPANTAKELTDSNNTHVTY